MDEDREKYTIRAELETGKKRIELPFTEVHRKCVINTSSLLKKSKKKNSQHPTKGKKK